MGNQIPVASNCTPVTRSATVTASRSATGRTKWITFISNAKAASEQTMSAGAQPPPLPDDPNYNAYDPETKTSIPFKPDNCLKLFGYGNLKFSYYNSAESTWP